MVTVCYEYMKQIWRSKFTQIELDWKNLQGCWFHSFISKLANVLIYLAFKWISKQLSLHWTDCSELTTIICYSNTCPISDLHQINMPLVKILHNQGKSFLFLPVSACRSFRFLSSAPLWSQRSLLNSVGTQCQLSPSLCISFPLINHTWRYTWHSRH